EFYRSLLDFGQVYVSPEFSSARNDLSGRIKFYIQSKKWGIELVRDGDRLGEHSDRFDRINGAYDRWMNGRFPDMEDFIILDFRQKEVRKAHPAFLNLYHVIFAPNFTQFMIQDRFLEVKLPWKGLLG
ncbi:hypothetical protein C8J57DRAFT_1048858, partial [Mycena rebaudengoi]